jgi:hypothetical protein
MNLGLRSILLIAFFAGAFLVGDGGLGLRAR